MVDGRFIAAVGTTGKYVGIITAEINQPKSRSGYISNISVSAGICHTNRLKSFKTNAGDKSIEEYYADKPTQLKVIRDVQETQNELLRQKSQIVNPVNYELIELDEKIEDDPVIRKKLNDFERRMNAKGYKITPAGD